MKRSSLSIARDTLLLLPRLLGASGQVLFQQWFSQPSDRLRKLTSLDWLAAQLGIDSGLLASAAIEEVHTGTASRMRLHIRYADPLEPTPGPPSLFIKSRPPDFAANLFGSLLDLGGNEVAFYRNIRPELPVRAPEVVYCEGDSGNYMMLLEDLATKGCSFRDLASRCTLDEAMSIFTTLARLHARFWQSDRFDGDLAWVKRFETNRDFRLVSLIRQLAVPISFEKYGHVLPESLHEVIPHLMSRYHRLEEEWAREPRTLIHGDAHLGNMYFQDGEAGLLDWQVTQLGQGMRDVSYFLINSMSEELRLAHQEELIRHYLSVLRDLGVSLGFDTAWRQYRLHSVYAWIAGVVTAPSNFQDERVVSAGLSRASRAILDLNAIELIREL